MAGTLTIGTLSDGTNSTSSTNAIMGSAKAWVNFNGTITSGENRRASFNVSSVTRNSTGDYTINMTNALTDANWVLVGTRDWETGNTQSVTVQVVGAQTKTASSARIYCLGTTASANDSPTVHVAIFR